LEENTMKKRLWLVLVVPLLASLACSVCGQAQEVIEVGEGAATQAAEVATAVGETGEELTTPESSGEGGTAEGGGPAIDPEALGNLESYRVRITVQGLQMSSTPEGMVMEQAYTRDPAARRFVIEGQEGERVEWVQIEDQAWYCTGGTCTKTQGDVEDLVSGFGAQMLDPVDFTNDADYSYQGQETLNGVRTKRYALDLSAAETAFLRMAQGDISDVEGQAWVADEPDLPTYVVRFELTWKETQDDQTETGELSYEVYDVNTPITIEPPEGAASSELPEDVPLYPEAEVVFSAEGVSNLTTPDDVATVADFYREELPAAGWTKGSDDEMEDMVSQVWNKDDRTLSLMISPGEEGGSSLVITIE
jgi:hypothetical protein